MGETPKPGRVYPRINLWLYNNQAPSDGQPQKVIIRSFNFRRNLPGSIVIEDNVDLTISGAGIGDDKIDFVLKYHFNLQDPDNLYWKLDLDSLKFSD